ncbi:hypothetical protein [Haloarchaeobius sp. DFWS5]|uniref:hypothetical protein n=1 Tax=Haloarchaeobius sp. DFWS5 TaxID=3446114 RepID=UPI003EBA6C3D
MNGRVVAAVGALLTLAVLVLTVVWTELLLGLLVVLAIWLPFQYWRGNPTENGRLALLGWWAALLVTFLTDTAHFLLAVGVTVVLAYAIWTFLQQNRRMPS